MVGLIIFKRKKKKKKKKTTNNTLLRNIHITIGSYGNITNQFLNMLRFKIPLSFSYSLPLRHLPIRYQSTFSLKETTTSNLPNNSVPTPKLSTDSSSHVSPTGNNDDLPINVKALYFPPLKIPVKYGHLKLDIQLRSYEVSSVEFFADFIQRVAFYLGIPMTGPKPLPRRHQKWTVIRSPFVHAKSKENFERFTYKRLLRCWDANEEVLELLLAYVSKYSIAGVGVKCNLFKCEPITNVKDWDDRYVFKQLHDIHVDLATQEDHSLDIVDSKILNLLDPSKIK